MLVFTASTTHNRLHLVSFQYLSSTWVSHPRMEEWRLLQSFLAQLLLFLLLYCTSETLGRPAITESSGRWLTSSSELHFNGPFLFIIKHFSRFHIYLHNYHNKQLKSRGTPKEMLIQSSQYSQWLKTSSTPPPPSFPPSQIQPIFQNCGEIIPTDSSTNSCRVGGEACRASSSAGGGQGRGSSSHPLVLSS